MVYEQRDNQKHVDRYLDSISPLQRAISLEMGKGALLRKGSHVSAGTFTVIGQESLMVLYMLVSPSKLGSPQFLEWTFVLHI
jgi:hypothetical protein